MYEIAGMNGHAKDEILLKKISLRIKELREVKGVSQEHIYNNTGIHIARVELGQKNISITTLARICDYLEITMEDFFKIGF